MDKITIDIRENINDLRDIALFLEGLKQGKGDLLPIGLDQLKVLWGIIRELLKQVKE